MKPKIAVIMGSASDIGIMEGAVKLLKEFKIPHEVQIISAHRTPDRAAEYAKTAIERGLAVIIAGAGMAAHLAGVLAAHTTLPVLGVPINAGPLNGVDAMLSTLQMPGGIPVATMSIGKAGAKNAALLAAAILSLQDEKLRARLDRYRIDMRSELDKKAKEALERFSS
ncbi:5-(carboxyamino)imidazole ribonucleotide mutase [Acidobacteriota bacterium]